MTLMHETHPSLFTQERARGRVTRALDRLYQAAVDEAAVNYCERRERDGCNAVDGAMHLRGTCAGCQLLGQERLGLLPAHTYNQWYAGSTAEDWLAIEGEAEVRRGS